MSAREQFLADLAAVCKRYGVRLTSRGNECMFSGDRLGVCCNEAQRAIDGPPRCPDCGGVLKMTDSKPNWCPACKGYVP